MMRNVLLALGGLLLAGAVAVSTVHRPTALPMAIAGALLVLGILFERHSYRPRETVNPGPGWRPTGEVFLDPASGEEVRVFEQPKTGERRYVSTEKK
jgi:hypothetical protein